MLENSGSLLKNQVRRYCEYLEIKERKIISILKKIYFLYFKKSRYGKLKIFDYINRLLILAIILTIGFLVYDHVKQNIQEVKNIEISNQGKSAIIYTPINYNTDESTPDNNDGSTNKQTSTAKNVVSHPPATANMSNMAIGIPEDDTAKVDKTTTKTEDHKPTNPATIDTVQSNDAEDSALKDNTREASTS